MAQWEHWTLIWDGRTPNQTELIFLSRLLSTIDYDLKPLTNSGWSFSMRSPFCTIKEFGDFLCFLGFPNKTDYTEAHHRVNLTVSVPVVSDRLMKALMRIQDTHEMLNSVTGHLNYEACCIIKMMLIMNE